MTAVETLEYAQTSVDQLGRGIEFVQDRLDQAENVALKVDELALTASDVVDKARRVSRFAIILGIATVVTAGIATCVIIRRRKRSGSVEAPEEATEILT